MATAEIRISHTESAAVMFRVFSLTHCRLNGKKSQYWNCLNQQWEELENKNFTGWKIPWWNGSQLYTLTVCATEVVLYANIHTHSHQNGHCTHKACFPLWVTNALSLPCFKTSLVLCSISDFLITRDMLQRQHTIWFKFGNIFRGSNMQRCLHHANGFNTFSSLLLLMGQQGIDACSFAMLHQVM